MRGFSTISTQQRSIKIYIGLDVFKNLVIQFESRIISEWWGENCYVSVENELGECLECVVFIHYSLNSWILLVIIPGQFSDSWISYTDFTCRLRLPTLHLILRHSNEFSQLLLVFTWTMIYFGNKKLLLIGRILSVFESWVNIYGKYGCSNFIIMKTMNFSIWLHQLEYVRLITDNLKVVILCEIKSMWQIAIFFQYT